MYQRSIKRKPLPSEVDERESKSDRIQRLPKFVWGKRVAGLYPNKPPFSQILKTPIDIVDPIKFTIFKS